MPYRDQSTPCPRCDLALEELRLVTRHTAHSCSGCNGIWTTPNVFREIAMAMVPGSKPPPIEPRDDHDSSLRCPVCHGPMQKVSVGEVALDWCRPHGAWFDFGELQAVLRVIAEAAQ